MKIIQGFVTIPELADNRVGAIAKFGEMSPHSMSFTRDLRNLSDTKSFPHIEILTVKAIDEASKNIPIPKEVSDKILAVGAWVHDQYIKSAIPLNSAKRTLEQAVTAELPYATTVSIGQILNTDIQGKRLIDYIRFDIIEGGETYRVTLWFSDEKFRLQYRYYEIEVIPPVDDIDRLIYSLPEVAVALDTTRIQSITSRINEQNRKDKFTELQTMSVKWVDPTVEDKNKAGILNTEWTLMIYGNAGIDTDAMKGAIRDYLYDNSDYKDWPDIFPELFSANEFIIIPMWDALATPNVTYDDGLYNTVVTTGIINAVLGKYVPRSFRFGDDPLLFTQMYSSVGAVAYRTMMFVALGNPANVGGVYTIEHLFPDYMAVSTHSPDFARMSENTQNFTLKLNDCFNKARLYTPNEKFPEGFTLGLKGAREYIGFDFNGYTWYVMTRLGYLRDI